MEKSERQYRINLHKKQDRLSIRKGRPSSADLQEGVPVLREEKGGLMEYVKHNGVLYKKELNRG